ncbi:MAG: hypothetical protein IPM54_37100 [Polyangiaceae bacterium]|nr:hypothetical protein [Polyangiaceae bacterium]
MSRPIAIGTTIKTIQDIMRKDTGVDGDARIVTKVDQLMALCDELLRRMNPGLATSMGVFITWSLAPPHANKAPSAS